MIIRKNLILLLSLVLTFNFSGCSLGNLQYSVLERQDRGIFRSVSSVEQRKQTIDPKRVISEVHPKSKSEQMYKLTNAKIVIVDYDLMRKDFPELNKLDNQSIDKWILENYAYIAIAQTQTDEFNTPIPRTDQTREAFRPPEYGRAAVFDAPSPITGESMGLVDVKGSGGVRERLMDVQKTGHKNGLATLGESIREFLYENMVRDVLHDANIKNKTVGSYFVLDAGFDLKWQDGSTSRAGYYARQSHKRNTTRKVNGRLTGNGWLDPKPRADFISVLAEYGIDPEGNVQGTVDNDLFDFGHYVVRKDMPAADSSKQIPFKVWGFPESSVINDGERWYLSKEDYPWRWSHELAEAFAQGRANRDDVWRHYQNFLAPVKEKLHTGDRPINKTINLDMFKSLSSSSCTSSVRSFLGF